jgi:hypothetical protein
MKLFVALLFASLSLPAFSGASCPWKKGTDVSLFEFPESSPDKNLTQLEIYEDLDCLHIVLNQNYLPAKVHPEAKIIEKLIKLKVTQKEQTASELLGQIFSIHSELIDLHLSYSLGDLEKKFLVKAKELGLPFFFKKTGYFFEAINGDVSEPLKECDILQPTLVSRGEGIYKFVKGPAHSASEQMNCTLKSGKVVKLGLYPVPELYVTNAEFEEDKIYRLQNGVIYIRPGNLLAFTTRQQGIIDYLKTSNDKIILDLSRNPGGEGIYAAKAAQALYTAQEKIPGAFINEVQSKFKSIGLANTLLSFGPLFDQETLKAYMENVSSFKDLSLNDLLDTFVKEEEIVLKGERVRPFKGQLIIITSSACSSACEDFSEKLGPHQSVKVIGKNTAGMIHYSNAATYILPNSGIKVYIPTRVASYDNEAEEGVGYPVDLKMEFIDLKNPEILFDQAFELREDH